MLQHCDSRINKCIGIAGRASLFDGVVQGSNSVLGDDDTRKCKEMTAPELPWAERSRDGADV